MTRPEQQQKLMNDWVALILIIF